MARIYPSLAATSLVLFLVAVVLGLSIGDLYAEIDEVTWRLRGVHMLTGTAAALGVVLVHSIAVTYFVGTSRWCKEVTETYKLDNKPVRRSAQLKRKTFPWCVLGMLTVVVSEPWEPPRTQEPVGPIPCGGLEFTKLELLLDSSWWPGLITGPGRIS